MAYTLAMFVAEYSYMYSLQLPAIALEELEDIKRIIFCKWAIGKKDMILCIITFYFKPHLSDLIMIRTTYLYSFNFKTLPYIL